MSKSTAKPEYHHAWLTAWGPVGAVATERGQCRFVLPHYRLDDLLELLAWEHPGSVRNEGPFQTLIELTGQYFNAAVTDFSGIECDLPSERTFDGKVLRACAKVPYGQTVSYGTLAVSIARPDAARAVAAALGRNAIPLVIPCHRVTYSDGRAGGFSAPGGVALKQRMLTLESQPASG